jgi:hypothetical protein
MLIGQDDLVKVRRDRDLVLFEVPQPGPFATNGVGQHRKDFAQRNTHRINGFGVPGTIERILGSVINSQARSLHIDDASLRRGVGKRPVGPTAQTPGRSTRDVRAHSPASLVLSVSAKRLLRVRSICRKFRFFPFASSAAPQTAPFASPFCSLASLLFPISCNRTPPNSSKLSPNPGGASIASISLPPLFAGTTS